MSSAAAIRLDELLPRPARVLTVAERELIAVKRLRALALRGASSARQRLGQLLEPPPAARPGITDEMRHRIDVNRDEAKRRKQQRLLEQANRAHAAMLVDPAWQMAMATLWA